MAELCRKLRGNVYSSKYQYRVVAISYPKILDQRMHSVQADVQFIYLGVSLCEFGRQSGIYNAQETMSVGL